MSRFVFFILATLASLPAQAQWKYPATRTVAASDTYFGVEVKDPYRWLENLQDQDVQGWFKAQADLTDHLLAKIPGRDALAREWMDLDRLRPAAYDTISCAGGRVFFRKTLAGERVARLYCRDGWDGADTLLFDPGSLKPGVVTSIGTLVPSFDGRYVAMGLTSGGAEYGDVRVLDVARRALLPDAVQASLGPIGWTPDSSSFFYDAGTVSDPHSLEVKLNRKTRLHRLGAPVAGDRDLFSSESAPDLGIAAREMPFAYVSRATPEYLLGRVTTVQNELRAYYAPVSQLDGAKVGWRALCVPSDNLVKGLAIWGGQVYAVTHADAPNCKLVRTSLAEPDWKHAETVVPEGKAAILAMARSRDFIFLVKSNGITGRLLRYQPATGRSAELSLPASGTVDISCPDAGSNRCLVSITGWTRPETLYDLDGDKGTFSLSSFNEAPVYPGFENLVAEEVEVQGHDGTQVPLSIIHRRGLPMDGSSCCILTGYGAYGAGYRPSCNVIHSIALRGVVVAYAHARGGDEKGEAWYRGGFQTTKPNTWKDFIACAEYLVQKGYTSPQHLGGTGSSAGGILISRAATERPDLFAAIVCNVGCANAMRLEFSPNGPINTPEFGTVKDPVQFKALYEMDGVQHVRPGVRYPAVLGVGGWNDPRVPAWQPGKFVAAVQQASTSDRPTLMKVNYDSGHFTEDKVITFNNIASQVAFLLWQAGHKDFQPVP